MKLRTRVRPTKRERNNQLYSEPLLCFHHLQLSLLGLPFHQRAKQQVVYGNRSPCHAHERQTEAARWVIGKRTVKSLSSSRKVFLRSRQLRHRAWGVSAKEVARRWPKNYSRRSNSNKYYERLACCRSLSIQSGVRFEPFLRFHPRPPVSFNCRLHYVDALFEPRKAPKLCRPTRSS